MMDSNTEVLDYANTRLDIQYAMIDHAKRFPDKTTRPQYLLWNGRRIWTSDHIAAPQCGVVRAEFLFAESPPRQGFDLKIDGGWLELAAGEHVPLLRTWKDDRYEDIVEYPFYCPDGRLWVWNVYEMTYGGGQRVEEKWTGNAGLWVEHISDRERIYHCSPGMANPPNFDALVFKISIRER